MSFGNNLKKIRLENNLTQEELAKKLKTSRSNIANYENDKNMPSVEILEKLSKNLNCSMDYLMGIKELKESGSTVYYTDESSKETHFMLWPSQHLSKNYIFIFNDEEPIFTLVGNGIEMPCNYFHVKMLDESMNLIFPKNTIIALHRQNYLDNEDIGIFYVNNEYMVRKYLKNGDDAILIPVTSNQSFSALTVTDLDFKILGKVINSKDKNDNIEKNFQFAYHKDMEGLTDEEISDALRFYKEMKKRVEGDKK